MSKEKCLKPVCVCGKCHCTQCLDRQETDKRKLIDFIKEKRVTEPVMYRTPKMVPKLTESQEEMADILEAGLSDNLSMSSLSDQEKTMVLYSIDKANRISENPPEFKLDSGEKKDSDDEPVALRLRPRTRMLQSTRVQIESSSSDSSTEGEEEREKEFVANTGKIKEAKRELMEKEMQENADLLHKERGVYTKEKERRKQFATSYRQMKSDSITRQMDAFAANQKKELHTFFMKQEREGKIFSEGQRKEKRQFYKILYCEPFYEKTVLEKQGVFYSSDEGSLDI